MNRPAKYAMQPSTSAGRSLRLAMLPVSWFVAAVVVYGVLAALAAISGTSISALLRTTSYWQLAVFFPALFFGKILGMMVFNMIAFSIPAARRIFDTEVNQTGRRSFGQAMKGLGIAATVTGVATLVGSTLFLWNR